MSNINLDTLEKLVVESQRFDQMTNGQKASFRARVTRYLNTVSDPTYKAILESIQENVGKTAVKQSRRLTTDDVILEYESEWDNMNGRERAAFKAKVTRLANQLKDSHVQQHVENHGRLMELSTTIETAEQAEQRQRILELAQKYNLIQD